MIALTVMIEWAEGHSVIVWLLSLLSVVTFAATLVAIPLLVARIPENYFTRTKKNPGHCIAGYPRARVLYLVVKNVVGIIFIVAGIIMLFIPGQGIVTILIGILMTNFPGKRKMALRMIRQPKVYKAINWMRSKSHRPPLKLPVKVFPENLSR